MRFTKMSGAGNDFVVLEDRGRRRGPTLARRLCPRRTSIGADGLLLVRKGKPPRVDYFNADGSRAFCGNGARCAAVWMHDRGWTGRRFSFQTSCGTLEAEIGNGGRARVRMPKAAEPRLLRPKVDGEAVPGFLLDTGVPHFVVPVSDLARHPVQAQGRALRRHAAFLPQGSNIDFVQWGRPLRIRTYERGVEAETLACGSGVVAAALTAGALAISRSPISVRTASGDRMSVSWTSAKDVWLEGPARIVCEGELP